MRAFFLLKSSPEGVLIVFSVSRNLRDIELFTHAILNRR